MGAQPGRIAAADREESRDMYEQRFRLLEPRALRELGLTVACFWGLLLFLLLLGGLQGRLFVVDLGFRSGSLLIYVAVLACGGAIVWLIGQRWTQTEVVVSPQGLALEAQGRPQWFVPWAQLACWRWDWHWSGYPLGLLIYPKTGYPLRLQLGFLGVGRRIAGVVQPYPQYLPLLKALGYYLEGEQFHEAPVDKGKKGLW
jgi:hypothetical protein